MSISTMKDKLKQTAQTTANRAKTAAQKPAQTAKTNTRAGTKSTDTRRNGKPAAQTAAKKVSQKAAKAVKTGSATPAKRVGKQAARTVAKKPQMQKAAQTEKGMQRTIDQTRFVRDMAARSAVQERSIARNRFLPQQPSGVMDRLGLQKYYEKGREENNPSTPIGMVKTTLSDTALDRVLLNDELSRKGYGLTGTPVPVQDILRASAGLAPLDLLTADSVSKAYFGRGAGVKSKQKEKTGKEKALDAAAKVKEHVRQGGARQQTTSRYDNRLKQQYREEIKLAKEDFEAAQRRGDAAGMAEAHERAETWRRIGGGFSGGADGSQYITPEISEEDKKILNKEGIAKLSAAKLGYMNAETDEDRARYAAMGDVVRGNPEYWKDTFSRGAYRNTDAEGRMRYGGTKEEREKEREQLTAIPKAIGTSLAGSFLSIPGTRLRALQEDASNNQGFLQNLSDIRGGGEVNVSKPEKQKTPEEMLAALFQDERYQNASPALKAKKLARTLADIKEEIPLNQRLLKKSQHHYKVATEDLNALEKSLTEAIIAGGEMIPSIVATWLSGGAALPSLATMYTQVSSKEMANQEMMGKDPLESYYRGVTQGAAETIPEALPWLRMLRMAGGTGGKFGREMGKLITENVLSDETSNFLGNAANKYIFKDEDAKVFDKDEILNTAAVSTFMALGMGTGAGMLGAKRGGRTGRQTEREAKTITAMDRVTPSVDELAEQEAALQAQVDTWKMQARRLLDRLQDSTQDPTWHKHLLNELSQHRAQFETLQQQLVGLEMQKAQRAQVEQEKAQQAQRQAEEAQRAEQERPEAQAVRDSDVSTLPPASPVPLPLARGGRENAAQEAPQETAGRPQTVPGAEQAAETTRTETPAEGQETARATSRQYGQPENHIDNRDAGALGDRKVKAFQWDHPEIKPFYQEAAQALKTEVEASLASRQTVRGSNKDRALGRKTGTLMARNEPLRKLHDLGLSSTDILKACDALISDHGQENVKAAKLVELALDDMLSNGYTPVEAGGNPDARIGANQDYIRTKEGIAGGVAQGSFEQVLRDNALPLELGEVTEEELRAEWEAAQGQKNTPPEAEESVQPERPHHPKGTDFDALVEQLQNNLEDLNNMEPVAVLDGTEIPKEGRATERVFSFLNRIGMSVLRPGFGDVLFSKNKIKSSFIGHGVSDAKIELMAGVPEVISKGDQIGFEPNWKGRGYDSYVFAGPVMYKGSPRIIGVIVNEYKGRGNKYYLHEVVDQNGDLIYGEKKEPEATSDGRTQGSGTVVTSDSETSIPQQDQNSNGNFAETTESSFQSEEEELADLQDRMEILMEEAETDGFNQEFFNEQLARMLEEERVIREKWSVGAAPGGFDPLSDWQLGTDQFHPINDRAVEAEAENWGRAPVDIPVRDPFGQLTSKTASTLINAGMTPDQISRGLAEMARNGQLSRIPYTDSAATAEAERIINEQGYQRAKERWLSDIHAGKMSKDLTTMGIVLYNNAANSGHIVEAMDLAIEMIEYGKTAGQVLQAVNIINKLGPTGKLYSLASSLEKLENKIRQNKKLDAEHWDGITIPEDLGKAYMEAQTEEEQLAIETEIKKAIAQQIPNTLGDKLDAWRYMAMLGNPRTQIRNIVGNLGFQPVRIAKNMIGAGLERMMGLDPSERTKSLQFKGLSRADKARYDAGLAEYDSVESIIMGNGKYNDTFSDIDQYRTIFRFKPFEGWRQLTNAGLEKGDVFFAKRTYADSLAGVLKARGITAEEYTDPAFSPQTREAIQAIAIEEAQKATYRDLNQFSQFIMKKLGGTPQTTFEKGVHYLTEGLLPFKKTPANILVRGIEYSPIGLIKGIADMNTKVRSGEMTAAQGIDELASGLTGTALMGLGAVLGLAGIVTPGDDEDDAQNKFNQLLGKQSYALNLPGGYSITLDWMAPEAIPFFMGVELQNGIQEIKAGEKGKDVIWNALRRISDPMLEMSMLQGVNDLLDNLSYADNKFMSVISTLATGYLTQFVPTIGGQIERSFEDRRYSTWIDRDSAVPSEIQYLLGKTFNKLPGEYHQREYLNAWGEPEMTGNPALRIFSNFISPGYIKKEQGGEVEAELQRLYDNDFNVFPTIEKTSTKINGEPMSMEQFNLLQSVKGQTMKDLYTQAINSDEYKELADADKADYLSKLEKYATVKGKQAAGENPDKVPEWIAKLDSAAAEHSVEVSALLRASLTMDTKYDADGNGTVKTEEAWDGIQDMTKTNGLSENEQKALFDIYNGTSKTYDEYKAEADEKARIQANIDKYISTLPEEMQTSLMESCGGNLASMNQAEAYEAITNLGGTYEQQKAAFDGIQAARGDNAWKENGVNRTFDSFMKKQGKEETKKKETNAIWGDAPQEDIDAFRSAVAANEQSYHGFFKACEQSGIPRNEWPSAFKDTNNKRGSKAFNKSFEQAYTHVYGQKWTG